MDKIVLKIPKKSEYMSTIRLTSSALANINGFDIEEIEDIKVIISEICTFFIRNVVENSQDLEILYEVHLDKISVKISDLNKGQMLEFSNDMSIMIIESLSDNYDYDFNNKTINFEKIKIRRWLYEWSW